MTTAMDFNTFSCLMHEKFQQVSYESHHLWNQDLSESYLYWINQEHAKKIAHELKYSMEYFHLCFTMFEPGAWKVLIENIPKKPPVIKKIVFHHMSGDEVTIEEVE
jgi:hypothetical protein